MTDRNDKWREELRATHTPKERTAIPRVKVSELDPEWRLSCSLEVSEGISL